MISLNDVLLAMSNIPVDDPIAEIWGRGLQGGYKIIEYTGTLPITITANGDVLIDYRIYGADGGVGVATESGEPAGYKLPMTAYKQEFVVTNDMLNQSNWILSPPHGDYEQRYFMYFDISASISKEECDAKVYKNFTDGYTPQLLVCALTDDIYPTVDTSYRILTNNGVILNKEFDFSSWDKIYLCIGYGNGFNSDADKQLKIDELFGNWKILIAPSSQTREAPVYIGENQLDSVEGVSDYVDKASGKIVRRIKEYTFTGEENWNKYGVGFYGKKFQDAIAPAGRITIRFSHFTARSNTTLGGMYNPNFGNDCGCLREGESNVMVRSTANFTTIEECKAYFKTQYDNGTPVKMWYIMTTPVEEDPPVPLPEIPTIDGTTIIDYDGDPKPSQMYIKYKGKG